MDISQARQIIETACASAQADSARAPEVAAAVEATLAALATGHLRVASPPAEGGGDWEVHTWLKDAIGLAFGLWPLQRMGSGMDRVPQRTFDTSDGVRVVPPASVRVGAHIGRGCVLMPSFVNIGAFVGAGTMVDTWATVGSCAQIGRDVHLSGGVGIGGVLEPASARPTIIEDGAFVGSRAVVVEGVRVGAGAVIGAGVVLTASTKIIDVRTSTPTTWTGQVPAQAVVIPGTRPRTCAGGTFQVPCALIVGSRTADTCRKTSLNQALRDHGVEV